MHYEEMLSWLLFYTSLLDVTKTPQLDVHRSGRDCEEPGGAVRGRPLRLALNGSQSQHTQSSRFLDALFGSGVQHIAFATDDLRDRRPAEGKRRGNPADPGELLRRSRGPRRFGGDRLQVLKAGNILYDKDDKGEYFQLYTESFENLFFLRWLNGAGTRVWRPQCADPP